MLNEVELTKINLLKEKIKISNRIVIISGAGVSTASGIPDFRSANGFYREGEVEKYLSRNFYRSNPYSFWKHFKEIFGTKLLSDYYEPNKCHELVKYLQDKDIDVKVFTQNIDGLYSKVTDVDIHEMHGHLRTFKCPSCKTEYDKSFIVENQIPYCTNVIDGEECEELLDTNVVLFGDDIKHYNEAVDAVCDADLVIIMGTSLQVFPVNYIATLPYVGMSVRINGENTIKDGHFDILINGDLIEVMEEIMNQ